MAAIFLSYYAMCYATKKLLEQLKLLKAFNAINILMRSRESSKVAYKIKYYLIYLIE